MSDGHGQFLVGCILQAIFVFLSIVGYFLNIINLLFYSSLAQDFSVEALTLFNTLQMMGIIFPPLGVIMGWLAIF